MKQIALFDIGIIGGFKMLNVLEMVRCVGIENSFDEIIPQTISTVVTIIKIGVPVLLVIFGMLDLGKAVMSNDEKEMKGAQTKLIKRVLYAVLIFFIFAIVQWVFGILDDNAKGEKSCLNCFINNQCTKA